MSGSARLRDSPRSGLIAAALCVLATAAVLITAPAVHSALRSGASGRQPLAPRLAALSDQELAQLLPKQSEFPASWTVDETTELSDTFGYFKYHVFDEGLGFDPIVCFGVVGVASTGAFDAAQVFGHDPAAQVAVADGKDILLTVGVSSTEAGSMRSSAWYPDVCDLVVLSPVLTRCASSRILGRPPVRSASGTHSRRRSVQSLPTRRALITTPTGAHQG